jgi:replicative DNA helicase
VPRALELLRDVDFYREAHRQVYRAAVGVWEAGEAVDPITVGERLKASGELESAGGYDVLSLLIDAVPGAAHLEQHARIVREKAVLRRAIQGASRLIQEAYGADGAALAAVGAAAQRLVAQMEGAQPGGFRLVKGALWDAFEHMERVLGGEDPGIPTGFGRLDEMVSGLQPGSLVVVAARPSFGKSALALNMLANVAGGGVPCAVLSFEMSAQELAMRMLAAEARVDFQRLRRGKTTPEDQGRLAVAAGHINTMPLYVDDHPAASVVGVAAKVATLAQREAVRLVVVDYLQLMNGGGEENRRLEIGAITRGLKLLAGRLGIAVVLLSPLSRAPDTRTNHRPMLSDLRESGDIEQDADIVLFLYRPEMYVVDGDTPAAQKKASEERGRFAGRAELVVAKQRNGPTGTVPLYFNKSYMRFESLEGSTHDGA